jgi:phosphate transport system substrate-binding protein
MERRIFGGIIAIVVIVVVIGGIAAWYATAPAPPGLSGNLNIAGSTTIQPIASGWASLLMEKNRGFKITVAGGGSGHGIKSIGAGEIDIGMSSRDIKPQELEMYPDIKPVGIAKDSVAIIVHPNNPIDDLTMEEVGKIFAGDIKNFKEVGGNDVEIHVITREAGSGTRDVFEENVMVLVKKDISEGALIKKSNGEVRAAVAVDKNSIAFLSLGYVDSTVKAVKLNGIEATVENVYADKYPIVRTLYLITKGEPDELEKAFIDFVKSNEGQKIVEENGYMPLR